MHLFNYYNGAHYEHYVIIDGIDFAEEEIYVIDPNNLDDNYFGAKTITFDELENTLLNSRNREGESADVFLSVYTTDKLSEYKYIY